MSGGPGSRVAPLQVEKPAQVAGQWQDSGDFCLSAMSWRGTRADGKPVEVAGP